MGTPHLDPQTLAAALRDPRAHPELAAHLASPCPQCEAALLEDQALDGAVDALLLGLAPAKDAPLDEAGFARVARALRPRRRRRLALSFGLGAVALLALFVARSPDRLSGGGDEGEKGGAVEVVELQAFWRRPGGELLALGPGAEVGPEGALVFRARSPRDAGGLLLVQRGTGPATLLHQVQLSAGLEDVRVGGPPAGAAGFSLDGERGPVQVWLVVGGEPTAPSLERALEAVSSRRAQPLAIGRFEVRVTP